MYLNSLSRLMHWTSEPVCSVTLRPKLNEAVSHSSYNDLCILVTAPPVPERWPPFHGKGLCLKSLVLVREKAIWLHRATSRQIAGRQSTKKRFRVWKIAERWGRVKAERVILPEAIEHNLTSALGGNRRILDRGIMDGGETNRREMNCHDFLEALLEGVELSRTPILRRVRGNITSTSDSADTYTGAALVRFFADTHPQLSHSALRLAPNLYISKLGTGPVTVSTFDRLAGLYYYTSHYQEWTLTGRKGY